MSQPHGLEEFLSADQAVGVLYQVAQDGEGLGPKGDLLRSLPELLVGEVKAKGRKYNA